jgi:hypothetical protein
LEEVIMKWVTRKGVKFDRTACAWAIKRFIDPEAEFGFLSGDDMPAAIEAGAKPFHNYAWTGNPADVPADRINFPRLLELYGLDSDPALVKFGELVKKAEKSGWAKDGSEQYSLFAIANGISKMVNGDDGAITERLMPIYDALYAFCKDLVKGDPGWMSDAG